MATSYQKQTSGAGSPKMHPVRQTWRVRGVPLSFDKTKLADVLHHHPALQITNGPTVAGDNENNDNGIWIHTLAPDLRSNQVATVRFVTTPPPLIELGWDKQLTIDIHVPSETTRADNKRKRHPSPTVRLAIDGHFNGITVLFAPPAEEYNTDILAVSGLAGHAYGSFVHKDDGNMWLSDGLPQDMPTARVMIYGHDSGRASRMTFSDLDDLAGSFQLAMCRLLRSNKRPLVLIGHSLDGLLIKEALIRITESDRDLDLIDVVFGTLFFGVPNDRMNIESLMLMLPYTPLRKSLDVINSQILALQKRDFSKVMSHKNFEMFCFYETRFSPTAARDGCGQYRMNGPPWYLVTRDSATSCLPSSVSSDHAIAIDRTHSDLVKFASHDTEYENISYVLGQIHQRCLRPEASQQRHCMVPFGRNSGFIGHEPILKRPLERIPHILEKDDCQRIAIEGLGGVGKTEIAVEAAYKIRDNELWKIRSEQSNFIVDSSEDAISLAQFIAERPHVLNGKTKRILAVLLGYAVLHLFGTGRSQPSWGSEKILFFKTGDAIPLKPYLQIHPTSKTSGPSSKDEQSEDEDDPDDDLFRHPYPCLVSLALILIELHQARPIQIIAQEHLLDMSPDMTDKDRFLIAGKIFASCKQDFEDQTRMAIDACLDVGIGGYADDRKTDEDALRNAIYQDIVRRLEDELERGYSSISVDGLDNLAQTLDLARFGRPIKIGRSKDAICSMQPRAGRSPPRKRSSNGEITTRRSGLLHAGPSSVITRAQARKWIVPSRLSFFDDQKRPEGVSLARQEAYLSWKESVCEVYEQFLPEVGQSSPVRIVVLDTGIDKSHVDFQAYGDRIKDLRSYTGVDRKHVHDSTGHGTHVTSLLLDYAPGAHIYVSKIAEDDPVSASIVASAINDAVKNWKPDIISMSFGWPARDDEYEQLEDALKNAQIHDVLLFAAASNDGANAKRAWPARHPGVICIHSASADGTPSTFNPLAVPGDNFAVIGEYVEGAWPRDLCQTPTSKTSVAYKSGTSYATPIAAGIAAFLLQYTRRHLPLKQAKRLKQFEGMMTVFRQISVEKQGYHYIAPRLHPDNFFGKGEKFVQMTLQQVLS